MGKNCSSRWRLASVSAALVMAVGCGGKPAKVSGAVSVDGKLLDQGTVFFAPAAGGMRASGIIQSDGSYVIKTNRDTGLEVGEYNVGVVSRELIRPNPGGPPMPGEYIAPKRYGNPKTSGLSYTVEQGSNEINLELSSDG